MEAISGIADLIGPALGALTMEHHIWLPFLLAILSFTIMFIPTLLLEDETLHSSTEINGTHTESLNPRSTNTEEQPLLYEGGTSGYTDGHERATPIRSTTFIYGITFISFFLVSFARDSNNFLIPWISWRFDESMARVSMVSTRPYDFLLKGNSSGWTHFFAKGYCIISRFLRLPTIC